MDFECQSGARKKWRDSSGDAIAHLRPRGVGALIKELGCDFPLCRATPRFYLRRPLMISVTVPICNEAGNLRALYERVRKTMTATGRAWELVLVNDGSTDESE